MAEIGLGPAERRVMREAHRLLYRSGPTPAAACERIRHELELTPQVKELVAFIETAKRGIIGAPPRGTAEVEAVD